MSTPYTYQVLKVAVAQICQNIGWYSITGNFTTTITKETESDNGNFLFFSFLLGIID